MATITIADGAAQVWLTYAMLPVGAYFFVLGVIDLRDHRRRDAEADAGAAGAGVGAITYPETPTVTRTKDVRCYWDERLDSDTDAEATEAEVEADGRHWG